MSPNANLIAANTRELHKQIRKAVRMLMEAKHGLRNASTSAEDTHARPAVSSMALRALSPASATSVSAALSTTWLKAPRRKVGT